LSKTQESYVEEALTEGGGSVILPYFTNTFMERINKAMAHRGLCTRRKADELIQAGVVFVNGKPAKLGAQVSETDTIEIRDTGGLHTIVYEYVAYYKPKGIVTHSPVGKQKDVAKVSGFPHLFPVGRLDRESEGLLMLTNDGRVTERLLHPRFAHEKEYLIEYKGNFPKNGEKKLMEGIMSDGELLTATKVEFPRRKAMILTLTEGKRHQVRRMLAALELEVEVLKRTRIMGIHLGALRPGEARVLTGKALKGFLGDIGLSF
jgi:pseudouridine synthase